MVSSDPLLARPLGKLDFAIQFRVYRPAGMLAMLFLKRAPAFTTADKQMARQEMHPVPTPKGTAKA
jgi:hypothetical protein